MFAYEPAINPPFDNWENYQLPLLCQWRIEDVCKDILKRKDKTNFPEIYDALYQLVEADVRDDRETI